MHGMILLNDAIVQRVKIFRNPKGRTISLKMLHHGFTHVESPARQWKEAKTTSRLNCFAMLAVDSYPKVPKKSSALAQREAFDIIEPLRSETRIALPGFSGVSIRNLCLHGKRLQVMISGKGSGVAEIRLNGRKWSTDSIIIPWKRFDKSSNTIEILRTSLRQNHQ